MKHINEDILDRYLRLPSSLDTAVIASINEHLKSCELCASVQEFLRSYYAELEQHPYVRTSKANELLDSFFPLANIIPLRPFVYKPDPSTFDSGYVTVLAADSVSAHRITSHALSSQDEDVVARILHDSELDIYKVYLIADDERKRQYVLIDLPELSIKCVTDKSGFVEFTRPERLANINLDSLQAVLHIPVFTQGISGKELIVNKSLVLKTESDNAITIRLENGFLHVTAESINGKRITRALITDSEKSILLSLQNGMGSHNIGNIPPEFSIRLYC